MPKTLHQALSPRRCQTTTDVGMHCDGSGLYMQVTPRKEGAGVNRSWIFRYRFAGRKRDLGLGSFPTVGLSDARELARQGRLQVLRGVDPIEARRAARAEQATRARVVTFKQAAQACIEAHGASWKSGKHAKQWTATLSTYVYPVVGALPVGDVTDEHVLEILRPIWAGKTETASRVRGRIESVLDYARASKWRSGDNPARWRGHLEHLLARKSQIAPVRHQPALPYRDVPAFMAELRDRDSISARALEWTILTAARTGDTIGATWSEIDVKAKTWTIPGTRMKGRKGADKRDHVVPLSDRCLEILGELPRVDDGLFPLSGMAMLELLRGMRPGLTVHGFRSTFRDWVGDTTSYPNEMAELALAHMVSDEVEAAYRRSDMLEKRRRMMRDWARFSESTPRASRRTKRT